MDYTFFTRKGAKEERIQLIDKGGVLIDYLLEKIKKVHMFPKSEVSAEDFCESTNIKCDELILRAVNNGTETGRYQINHFRICAGSEEMSVMLVLREIMPKSHSKSTINLYAHIFFNLATDEKGRVTKIYGQTRLFFPSVRTTPLEPIE